jgi:hypothetical protein
MVVSNVNIETLYERIFLDGSKNSGVRFRQIGLFDNQNLSLLHDTSFSILKPRVKMKNNLFKSAVLAAMFVAGVPSVQAATFTMIGGTNIDFYYDNAFWGNSIASVSGNTLNFSALDGFDSASTAKRPTASAYANNSTFASPGVVAVAHTGYMVGNNVTNDIGATYVLSASGGYVGAYSQFNALPGTFSKDVFTYGAYYYSYGSVSGYQESTGTKESGILPTSFYEYSYGVPFAASSVIGLDTYISVYTGQTGAGTSSVTPITATYGFTAIQNTPPVSAVPEPESYAMMLAGLGLMGFVARRKKQA